MEEYALMVAAGGGIAAMITGVITVVLSPYISSVIAALSAMSF